MERHKQFRPLVTVTSTLEPFDEPDHSHNYYEFIYIKKGKGKHFINGEMIEFGKGKLFLIDPNDIHHFEVEEKSEFVVIQFTESFISGNRNAPAKWSDQFKYLISSRSFRYSMLQFDQKDAELISHIFDAVILAQGDENIILFQVLSIIEIIHKSVGKENIKALKPEVHSDGKIEHLLAYIHENITIPQKLRIKDISLHFGISNHYVSAYFKRNMGLTLRKYIDKYRMELIKKRLLNSNFTVKEIAFYFGFTDESHLNKFFKKYYGLSAKAYRKAH